MDRNPVAGACPRKSIAVFGAARTGKTSLIKEFFTGNEDCFSTEYTPTVEDSYFHLVRMPDGYYYQLQVIDTGGAHSFPAMRDLCISTSDCFMLVFSYDSRDSWHECLALYASIKRIKNEVNPAVIFVANKSDLTESEREVDEKHVRHMCEARLLCKFMSTSAKTYSRVNALYEEVVAQTWQYTQRRHSAETVAENDRRRFRSIGINMLRRVSMAAAIPLRGSHRLLTMGSSTTDKSSRRDSAVPQSTSMTIPDAAISPFHTTANNFSFDACELSTASALAYMNDVFGGSVERRDSGIGGGGGGTRRDKNLNDSPLSSASTARTSPEDQREQEAFRRRVASSSAINRQRRDSASTAATTTTADKKISSSSRGKAMSVDGTTDALFASSRSQQQRSRVNSIASTTSTLSPSSRATANGGKTGGRQASWSVASEFARASAAGSWSLSRAGSSSKDLQSLSSTFSHHQSKGSPNNNVTNGGKSRRSTLGGNRAGTVTSGGEDFSSRNSLAANEKRQMFARSKQTSLTTTAKPAAVTANRTMIYLQDAYDPDYN